MLIVVLTFFFVKDGARIWDWIVGLFHPRRRKALNDVLYPVVVGRRMQLHPVAILLALTAGGVLAGVAGAFLAVPIAAVTAAVLEYVRQN